VVNRNELVNENSFCSNGTPIEHGCFGIELNIEYAAFLNAFCCARFACSAWNHLRTFVSETRRLNKSVIDPPAFSQRGRAQGPPNPYPHLPRLCLTWHVGSNANSRLRGAPCKPTVTTASRGHRDIVVELNVTSSLRCNKWQIIRKG
jgi:hypothetical protein